jgi:enoyl-CoA hydratase
LKTCPFAGGRKGQVFKSRPDEGVALTKQVPKRRRRSPSGHRVEAGSVGQVIERDDVDDIAVVRLAHGKVNALDLELCEAIARTFAEIDAGPSRAIVLTGSGRTFSAGVDLWRLLDAGAAYSKAFLPALVEAFEAVFGAGKPVVAAVNGHAVAGGCILVSGCDRRLMAAGCGRIGVTELPVGVPFPVSALEILRFALGTQRTREAVLVGATYEPEAAVARGYLDEVVPPERLLVEAVATARRLASVPADTYRFTKDQLRRETVARIARLRPQEDPRVAEIWSARVDDGHIRAYMESVTRRG